MSATPNTLARSHTDGTPPPLNGVHDRFGGNLGKAGKVEVKAAVLVRRKTLLLFEIASAAQDRASPLYSRTRQCGVIGFEEDIVGGPVLGG